MSWRFPIFATTLLLGSTVLAQERVDPDYESMISRIGTKPEAESQVPLDAVLVDHTGKTVPLETYFDGKRPVILNLLFFT